MQGFKCLHIQVEFYTKGKALVVSLIFSFCILLRHLLIIYQTTYHQTLLPSDETAAFQRTREALRF